MKIINYRKRKVDKLEKSRKYFVRWCMEFKTS